MESDMPHGGNMFKQTIRTISKKQKNSKNAKLEEDNY